MLATIIDTQPMQKIEEMEEKVEKCIKEIKEKNVENVENVENVAIDENIEKTILDTLKEIESKIEDIRKSNNLNKENLKSIDDTLDAVSKQIIGLQYSVNVVELELSANQILAGLKKLRNDNHVVGTSNNITGQRLTKKCFIVLLIITFAFYIYFEYFIDINDAIPLLNSSDSVAIACGDEFSVGDTSGNEIINIPNERNCTVHWIVAVPEDSWNFLDIEVPNEYSVNLDANDNAYQNLTDRIDESGASLGTHYRYMLWGGSYQVDINYNDSLNNMNNDKNDVITLNMSQSQTSPVCILLADVPSLNVYGSKSGSQHTGQLENLDAILVIGFPEHNRLPIYWHNGGVGWIDHVPNNYRAVKNSVNGNAQNIYPDCQEFGIDLP